jgi:hypothetical protein
LLCPHTVRRKTSTSSRPFLRCLSVMRLSNFSLLRPPATA